jgi:hypothetical protein
LPSSTSAGSPVRAYPHVFRTGAGHRVKGGSSWHSDNPLESASCGSLFRRLVRSLSLRPFWLFAPWTDPTETVRCLSGRLGLVHPGFQPSGSPRRTAGYSYDAIWGPASAGFSPASRSASFAAFLSQAFLTQPRVHSNWRIYVNARPRAERGTRPPVAHQAILVSPI